MTMQITKEFLEVQIKNSTARVRDLEAEMHQHNGAIQYAQFLLKRLSEPEPEAKPDAQEP